MNNAIQYLTYLFLVFILHAPLSLPLQAQSSHDYQVANNRPSGIKKSYLKSKETKSKTKQYKASTSKKKKTKKKSSSKKRYYKVRKGDNLSKIAKKFGVSTKAILQANKIKNPNKLYVGKRLTIPGSAGSNSSKKSSKSASNAADRKKAQNAGLRFHWPTAPVRSVKRDGEKGVKSIGILISSNSSNVKAAEKGVISKIGSMRGFGNYVVVKHASRYMTVYANLSHISVREGAKVSKGTKLGTLSESTLHFQINRAGKPQDALAILPKR